MCYVCQGGLEAHDVGWWRKDPLGCRAALPQPKYRLISRIENRPFNIGPALCIHPGARRGSDDSSAPRLGGPMAVVGRATRAEAIIRSHTEQQRVPTARACLNCSNFLKRAIASSCAPVSFDLHQHIFGDLVTQKNTHSINVCLQEFGFSLLQAGFECAFLPNLRGLFPCLIKGIPLVGGVIPPFGRIRIPNLQPVTERIRIIDAQGSLRQHAHKHSEHIAPIGWHSSLRQLRIRLEQAVAVSLQPEETPRGCPRQA